MNEYIRLNDYTIMIIDSPTYGSYNIFIDNEDYELVKDYQWRLNKRQRGLGFYVMNTKNKILLHRLLMNPPQDMVVDHINRNPLDNRRSNLRICDHRTNNLNRYQPKYHKSNNKTTGIHGLSCFYSKTRKKYLYAVKVNGCKQCHFYSKENAMKYLNECKQGLHKKEVSNG